MLGMFCALLAAAAWLLIATILKLPVSTTHSIIGAILGFSLVEGKGSGILWGQFGVILLSWVI